MKLRPADHPVAPTASLAVLAAAAYFGAFGLITGLLKLDAAATARLPFASPVFGGLALAVVVAVPMTVAAWLWWFRSPLAPAVETWAGVLLVVWIAVEVLMIREFSPLQVICGAAGVILIAIGARRRRAG